jgi:serine/threonine-protein kinase
LDERGVASIADAVAIVGQVGDALEYAHARHVQHHDLKPENVLILKDGGIKLIDFGGGTRDRGRLPWRRRRSAAGTPDYAPPELVKGSPGDERTDVYELGELLYELLTGSPPFAGDSPAAVLFQQVHAEPPAVRALRPEVSASLAAIVNRAMEKDPRRRYQRVQEMRDDLRRAGEDTEKESEPPRRPGTGARAGDGADGSRT